MISEGRCNQLLSSGFSLITVGDNKVPNIAWKKYQTQAATPQEFEGLLKLQTTKNVGIVTGFNDVQCLDIDLKVLPSLAEQQSFWKEFISFVSDNIDDFQDKFVIYKTINNGYHILFRCKEIEGNKKLAKLQGNDQAIFETRGKGGYVFVYDRKVGKLDYTEIKEISAAERECLFECAKIYDYKEPEPDAPKVDKAHQPEANKLSTWDDYNAKNNVLDLIADEMSIVRVLNTRTVVKRHGATSPHSGYVFKDTGLLYLFSTGTQYPAEKALSPFAVYAHKYHRGDFSEAARELYREGYGDRKVSRRLDIEKPKIKQSALTFPVDVFPAEFQDYIIKSQETLSLSIDYMGCSLLWMLSLIVGNTAKLNVKTGWDERAPLWLCLVGKAGVGKSPSINQIIRPMKLINSREIKKYDAQMQKFAAYEKLGKEERGQTEKVTKPNKSQFIVDDATIEALVQIHQDQKKSVGIFKDELSGWFNDMNKYRAGSDLQFYLSTWSCQPVHLNRKTAISNFVHHPFIPIIGGIQPGILEKFSGKEYSESGFLDRLLIAFPEMYVEEYVDKEMDQQVLDRWDDLIIDFYNKVENYLLQWDSDAEIEPLKVNLSDAAKKEWIKAYNRITAMQNSSDESEFFKSMLPKQKTYIPRFALLIHLFDSWYNDGQNLTEVSTESIKKAVKLSDYFIEHAKRIKSENRETEALRKVMKGKISPFEQFQAIWEANPELPKTKIADLIGVSRNTVYAYIKKLEG